jgi:hypothetical protein
VADVCLIRDIFDVDGDKVARDVVALRLKHAKHAANNAR